MGEQAPTLTDAELTEIEARANAATPGPWRTVGLTDDRPTVMHHETPGGWLTIATVRSWDRIPENATFISDARAAVPRLVAAVRAAKARADKAEAIAKAERALRLADVAALEAMNDDRAPAEEADARYIDAIRERRAAKTTLRALGVEP